MAAGTKTEADCKAIRTNPINETNSINPISTRMGRYQTEEQVSSKTRDETKEPSMYRVLLHNDDYTTMEFVVEVLMYVFNKSPESAAKIMLNVHQKGIGICGVYTHEVAETKVDTVHNLARESGYPLRCSMEQE